MKKFFLVSVSMLLILFLGFGIWFGVSYARNGVAKQLYDKVFNVEEPTEEPTEEPQEPEEPEEPEESENYAYKIVVNKPEDVAVPETGTMRNVKVGDKLGGKWYAVNMEHSYLFITADNLVFLNDKSQTETLAFINTYFGIEIFPINNGFLFYLPEEFSGTYYVSYDEELNIELNRDFVISWNKDTVIDSVDCELFYIEESEQELIFPYDIDAYQFDVTILEGVEAPTTGTLRKVEVGETLGGKWYAVDCNQYNLEKLTDSYLEAGSIHFTNYSGELDTFVVLNAYSCVETSSINYQVLSSNGMVDVNMVIFFLPESIDIKRYVGYDAVNDKLITEDRIISWNNETVITNASDFVYVIEESEDELIFPYATDEAYCAYKMDVTIPEGIEAPTTGTLRKVEVGETLGGKWYAVDIERIKAEKLSKRFLHSHEKYFTIYEGCDELDTLVCMNNHYGVESVTVGNVTMFYLPKSISIARNVGYDNHISILYNVKRSFSWNSTTDITAVGEYVYVVEEGDGELKFPVEDIVEPIDYSEVTSIYLEPRNFDVVSGDKIEISVYMNSTSSETITYPSKIIYNGCGLPSASYSTIEVTDKATGELVTDTTIIDNIFNKMCSINANLENGKVNVEFNYVKEYSDDNYSAVLPEDFLVILIFDIEGDVLLENQYVEIQLN